MSEFFEALPVPDQSRRRRQRNEWAGPPRATVPGVVPVELLLARSERAAVCVSHVAAYPSGFEFAVLVFASPQDEHAEGLEPMLFGPHWGGYHHGEPVPEPLRIGVQFADGTKATDTESPRHGQGQPSGPILVAGGGGGGDGCWQQTHWVWPLPPPGPLQIVCQWAAADIPLSRQELDARLIRDAAERAHALYPE